MIPISYSSKTIVFPTNCARCNRLPGTERWSVSGGNSFSSRGNTGYPGKPNARTTTTVKHSVEVPICPVCVAELQAAEEQEKVNAKKEDRKIKLAIGVFFAIGALFGILLGVFSDSEQIINAVFGGVCFGAIMAFVGAVAIGAWGLLSGLGKKKKSIRDFVRFEMGFLQFDNQEYQREFDRLNSLHSVKMA